MVISLCESVTLAWSNVEELNNPSLLGKVAVILESERKIDELCLEKEDSRIVLFVENLNI